MRQPEVFPIHDPSDDAQVFRAEFSGGYAVIIVSYEPVTMKEIGMNYPKARKIERVPGNIVHIYGMKTHNK
jgi:hypothetical protein